MGGIKGGGWGLGKGETIKGGAVPMCPRLSPGVPLCPRDIGGHIDLRGPLSPLLLRGLRPARLIGLRNPGLIGDEFGLDHSRDLLGREAGRHHGVYRCGIEGHRAPTLRLEGDGRARESDVPPRRGIPDPGRPTPRAARENRRSQSSHARPVRIRRSPLGDPPPALPQPSSAGGRGSRDRRRSGGAQP